MAEPTLTRKQLRRAIATELAMPFFRRTVAQERSIDTGSTTTNIIDDTLLQPQGYWNGHWFYGVEAGDVSVIRAFDARTHSFELETPMASTPDAGDKYEIHSLWNAIDIHNAINSALKIGSRSFPETINDETMVVCEDKMKYDITGLTYRPFIINKVFVEKPASVIRGAVAAGAAGSLTISEAAATIASVTSAFLVSVYAGTGAGQVKAVTSVSGQQVNVASWTTTPDSTSKYAIWNPNVQRFDWQRIDIYQNDANEFPDTISLRSRLPFFYGMRMRIQYLYANTELSTDAATTIIPEAYLKAKAMAILHAQKLNDTKADRDLHFSEYQRLDTMAVSFLANNAPRMPGVTLQASESPTYMDTEDPLGWMEL